MDNNCNCNYNRRFKPKAGTVKWFIIRKLGVQNRHLRIIYFHEIFFNHCK